MREIVTESLIVRPAHPGYRSPPAGISTAEPCDVTVSRSLSTGAITSHAARADGFNYLSNAPSYTNTEGEDMSGPLGVKSRATRSVFAIDKRKIISASHISLITQCISTQELTEAMV